jgi:hypothetical protein
MGDAKTVYLVVWKQDRANCVEVFDSRTPAVEYANYVGAHARVISSSLRGAGFVAMVTGKPSEVSHGQG